MYCKEHPDYEAKRRPRVPCHSCWRLYLEKNNHKLEAIASTLAPEQEKWLYNNASAIKVAPLAGMDTYVAKAQPVTEAEIKAVEEVPVGPARGVRI